MHCDDDSRQCKQPAQITFTFDSSWNVFSVQAPRVCLAELIVFLFLLLCAVWHFEYKQVSSRYLCVFIPLLFRYVCIAMEALDQLLMACHCQSINLFVESFLKMVRKLLESDKPSLQILGTNSVSFQDYITRLKFRVQGRRVAQWVEPHAQRVSPCRSQ